MRKVDFWTGIVILSLSLSGGAAQAFYIHYDLDRAASLRECDRAVYRGNEEEATTCYQTLLETGNLLERADAAAALGDIRQANKLYREAAANSTDPAIKTHWARLYLQTHQTSDAEALFREALIYDETWLPARIGLAEALSEGFEGQAREVLRNITVEHPDNVHALLLLARIELELQNLSEARGLAQSSAGQGGRAGPAAIGNLCAACRCGSAGGQVTQALD